MGQTSGVLEPSQVSIVLIEDDDADAELVLSQLVSAGLKVNVVRATSKAQVRAALTRVDSVDAVLCAYRGKGVKVWQALEIIKASVAAAPLIVVSRGLSDEQAAECMRLGATDYILKERMGRLPHALTQAIHHTRAERALRQSEEVFRVLFEQSAVGISLTEVPRDGVPSRPRWNSRMREILGVEGNPGHSRWQPLVTEDEQKDIDGKFSRLLSGETDQLRERRMMTRPDGKTVWVDWSTVIVRDRDQQPLSLQTMVLDITEQVEAEHLLSKRVAQQAVLLELSRAGLEGSEIGDFLATAVELVAHGTETQFATILEMRPTDQMLIRVASHGFSKGISPDQPSLDASLLILDTLKSQMPVVTFDWQAQPDLSRSPWMIERGVIASMGVGIQGTVRPFGTVVAHSNVARDFSSDDLQFMQMASTIISRAVERKRGEKQRQMLLGRVVSVQEAERKAIAEDIHDDAVQVMTAANMRLELFRMGLTDPAQLDAARKLQETISLAIGRLRSLLFELVPPDLDRHGLAAAFRGHLEQFQADAGTRWELRSDLTELLSPQVRILLFRIFQEALVNVRKHAHATTVMVSLETVDGGALMRLSDDGAGFNAAALEHSAGHLGLASMRERAEIAGGWLQLASQPGRGTEITTWVPAAHNDQETAATAAALVAVG